MDKNKLTTEEKAELNEISFVLKGYAASFKFSPEITQGVVIVYWDTLKEYGYNAKNLNNALSSLSKRMSQFPSLLDVRREFNGQISEICTTVRSTAYSVISQERVAECMGNRELIFKRFLSPFLLVMVDETQFREYLGTLISCINSDRLFYEVAYCRLYQMKMGGLTKPRMTIPKIWRFCGLVKSNHGFTNVADVLKSIKVKKI